MTPWAEGDALAAEPKRVGCVLEGRIGCDGVGVEVAADGAVVEVGGYWD